MESSTLRLSNKVREALHNITGLLDLASEEPLSETQLEYLSRCRESAERLVRTANDLAELDRSSVISQTAPFAMAGAMAEVADLMAALAHRKGLLFDWNLDASVPASVNADKCLVQDTLLRLLDNAIRFTTSGSVRFSVSAVNSVLGFEISDTGPGIDHAIFAGLERVDDVCVQGLGLRIVRKRLADLGGELYVSASSSAGTTFRFTIPAEVAIRDANRSVPREATENSPRMAILVAEDSDDGFRLFEAYTKSTGYSIARARDGAEAIRMFKSGDYDFVVMDVNMPVMNGYRATQSIREWETEHGRVRVPILLLSADEEERQINMGAAAGCSGYLTKPATKDQVLNALSFYAQTNFDPRGRTN
jgi:CheY-like chemotaxis protein